MIPKSTCYQLRLKETGTVIAYGSKNRILRLWRRDYARPGFEMTQSYAFRPEPGVGFLA